MKLRVALAASCLLVAGCANNIAANRISSESYKDDKQGQSYSRVFAWDSKYSAGIGNSNGLCAQGALTAEASNIGAALNVISKKVDTEARGAIEAAEAVTALNVTNAQTAYANIGYFYACQIALNSRSGGSKGLGAENIVKLFESVSETIPKITHGQAQIAQAQAEQLEAFKAYLLKEDKDVPEDLDKAIADAKEEADKAKETDTDDAGTSE